MSDPPLSNIDFKNEMVWVWTVLNQEISSFRWDASYIHISLQSSMLQSIIPAEWKISSIRWDVLLCLSRRSKRIRLFQSCEYLWFQTNFPTKRLLFFRWEGIIFSIRLKWRYPTISGSSGRLFYKSILLKYKKVNFFYFLIELTNNEPIIKTPKKIDALLWHVNYESIQYFIWTISVLEIIIKWLG